MNFANSRQGEHRSFGLELPVEAVENKIRVLILQHPQEPDKVLGSAVLCVRSLKNAELKIGLSWANFGKLVPGGDPAKWGILYLGAQKDLPPLQPGQIAVLNKKSEPVLPIPSLEGIILLDGTWSQAKTMWWRNPWFLKLKRIVLRPEKASAYGKLRKEPRREALSTIEACAQTLAALGEEKQKCQSLEENFGKMLRLFKESKN